MHNNFDKIPVSSKLDEAVGRGMKEVKKIRNKKVIKKVSISVGSVAAAFTVMLLICINNPVMASKLPLIGNIFEKMQDKTAYPGDYSEVKKPLVEENEEQGTIYTQTQNGITITLSEIYCNSQALYLSLIIKSEEKFPEEAYIDSNHMPQEPMIGVNMQSVWDFNAEEDYNLTYLSGDMVDEYTYAGIMRIDLNQAKIDYSEQRAAVDEAVARGELRMEDDVDWTIYDHLIKEVEIPDSFKMTLNISRVFGDKVNPELIDWGMTTEELEALSEEEYNALNKEKTEDGAWFNFPNEHENYWYDGLWTFELDVEKDNSRTEILEIGTTNEVGIGIASVEKTPFEITMYEIYEDESKSYDYFSVMTDANGDLMPSGNGSTNTYAIQDRDISKVDIFICDYNQYMDELKGYYWSDDYEEKRKEKTFKEYLQEYAVYHTEVNFDTNN